MALFNFRLHGLWLLLASIAAGSSAAGFQSPMMQSPMMQSPMVQSPMYPQMVTQRQFQTAALPPGARFSSTPVMMPFETQTESPLVTSVDPMQTSMMYQDSMMSGPQPSMPFGGDGDCGCAQDGDVSFGSPSGFENSVGSECSQCDMPVGDCGGECFNDPYSAPYGAYEQPMYGGCANDGMCPIAPPVRPYTPIFQNPDYGCGNSGSCNTCCPCGNAPAFWTEASALIWWTTPASSPVLATTSNAGVPQTAAGVLGTGTTQTLFGGEDLFGGSRGGFRLRSGFWFDPCGINGIDSEYFILGKASESLHVDSDGTPIIARPFTNFSTGTGVPDSQLIAFPGLNTGSLDIKATSRLNSMAVHFRRTLVQRCSPEDPCTGRGPRNFSMGLQIGPRFASLRDRLSVNESTTSLDTGDRFDISDSFGTKNRFYGGELGLYASSQRRRFTLDGGIRVALGVTQQDLDVSGRTVFTPGPNTAEPGTSLPGGLLAQRTNSGSFDRSKFSVVPQFDVSVGYKLTDTWRFSVGYNLMYWNSVLRATEQIDTELNPNLLPPEQNPLTGPLKPAALFNDSEYFAQGISIGLEKRW